MTALERRRRLPAPQQLDDSPAPTSRETRLTFQRALTTFAPIMDLMLAGRIDDAEAAAMIARGRKTVAMALEQTIGAAPAPMLGDVMTIWCRHAAEGRELDANSIRSAIGVAISGIGTVWGNSTEVRSFPFTDRTFMVAAMADIAAELDGAIAETGNENPVLLPGALDHIAAAAVNAARNSLADAGTEATPRDLYNLAQNFARRIGRAAAAEVRQQNDAAALFPAATAAAARITAALAAATRTTDLLVQAGNADDLTAPGALEPQEPACS